MAFWNNIKWPYQTMQQLNLDWLLTELKRIAGFMPEDGNVGDVLMKKSEGASWEPPEAIDLNINNLPQDTEMTDTDKLVFYDVSAEANRKIAAPDMLNSMMSNAFPLMDGTASAGTSKKPARYDHRHPTDTSRQAALSTAQLAACNSGITAAKVDKLDAIYDYQTGVQTIDGWTVVDYASGYREAYISTEIANQAKAGSYGNFNYCSLTITFPTGLFNSVLGSVANIRWGTGISWGTVNQLVSSYAVLLAFGNQDNVALGYTLRVFGYRSV